MNPLDGVFREAWELWKGHWRHFATIALVVYVVVALIGILLVASLGLLGALLALLVTLAGAFWLQGTLIEAVRDVRDGRADLSVKATFERVLPRLNRIALAGIVLAVAIGLGFILFVVPGLFLMTIWLMVIPAIVLEDRGLGEAFDRSRELVRGNGWNLFLVIILTFILIIGVSLALRILLSPLEDWIAGLIADLLGNTIVAPFAVVVWTLSYYRLRAREQLTEAPAAAAGEFRA
ncbi:MAG TPA: hypothetical protein VFR63_07120 [Gaiellaceae bacterium]|nr:hypothetical protein [Gaiellaceae bacterium]